MEYDEDNEKRIRNLLTITFTCAIDTYEGDDDELYDYLRWLDAIPNSHNVEIEQIDWNGTEEIE